MYRCGGSSDALCWTGAGQAVVHMLGIILNEGGDAD